MIRVIIKIFFIRVERSPLWKKKQTIFSRRSGRSIIVVAGCSQSTSTSDSAKETTQVAVYHKADVTRPDASFDWNASRPSLTWKHMWNEQRKIATTTLDGVVSASFSWKRKRDYRYKSAKALEIVDAVFVNQKTLMSVQSCRATSQERVFWQNIR